MKKLYLLTLFIICACVPVHQMVNSPDYTNIAKYKKSGTATIKGQAFLKRNDGQVVTCAGEQVILLPSNAYTAEASQGHIAGGDLVNFRDYANSVMRKTVCDAQGNFVFTNLPAASWLVASKVDWMAGNLPQGGELKEHVVTKPHSVSNVILAR